MGEVSPLIEIERLVQARPKDRSFDVREAAGARRQPMDVDGWRHQGEYPSPAVRVRRRFSSSRGVGVGLGPQIARPACGPDIVVVTLPECESINPFGPGPSEPSEDWGPAVVFRVDTCDVGVTCAAVAEAFGITTQTAQERFRSGPDGLLSRFDRNSVGRIRAGGLEASSSASRGRTRRDRSPVCSRRQRVGGTEPRPSARSLCPP